MLKKFWQQTKEQLNELKIEQGALEISGITVTVICILFELFSAAFLFLGRISLDKNDEIFFGYLAFVLMLAGMLFVTLYYYARKKNANKNIFIKKFMLYIIGILLMLSVLWIILGYILVNLIGTSTKLITLAKYCLTLLCELIVYMSGYLACWLLAEKFMEYGFAIYIIVVVLVYIGCSVLRYYIRKIYGPDKYEEKYRYVTEWNCLQNYILIVVSTFCSVIGLIEMQSPDYIYWLIPLIVFVGCKQVVQIPSWRKEKRNDWFRGLYEEMVFFRDVVIPMLQGYSNITVKLRLSKNGYAHSVYVKHLLDNSYGWRKAYNDLLVKETDSLKECLNYKYNLLEGDDYEKLIVDLNQNINLLAECMLK